MKKGFLQEIENNFDVILIRKYARVKIVQLPKIFIKGQFQRQYIMIDQQEIEKMLQDSKVSSISDIVSFITTYVERIAFQSIEDLQNRVNQLQKPKGMDRIMLQQVKTLVQAMIDQRQQGMGKQMEKRYKQNVCNSIDFPQYSRRSLNELDFGNIINMQKPSQIQQIRKMSSVALQPQKTQNINQQILEIREEIYSKPNKKDFIQVKNVVAKLEKQIISKVSFCQTEKLILQFEKEIFMKLNENKIKFEEIQYKMQAKIQQQMQKFTVYFQQIMKAKGSSKFQKKIKLYHEQISGISFKMEKIQKNNGEKHRFCLQNIQSLRKLVQQLSEDKNCLLSGISRQAERNNSQALWISAPPTFKNSQIAWERQLVNTDPNHYQFQAGKTGVRIISAGFYEISSCVYGGNGSLKKAPLLLCNSQIIGKMEVSSWNSECSPRWKFRQCLHIRQNRCTLSIRFQGQENSSCVLLSLRKLPC